MERYFRIQNSEGWFEGEFVTLNEAISHLQARNDEEIQHYIESGIYKGWAIAEVQRINDGVSEVVSVHPFRYEYGHFQFTR